jgi:hypothetical protein
MQLIRASFIAGLALILSVALGTQAFANPTFDPTSVTPGSKGPLAVTYTLSGESRSNTQMFTTEVHLYSFTSPLITFTNANATVTGSVVTCAFTGFTVTWENATMASLVAQNPPTSGANVCYAGTDVMGGYIYYGIQQRGLAISAGPQTFRVTVGANGFTAPTTSGDYRYETKLYQNVNDSLTGTLSVREAVPAGGENSQLPSPAVYQGLPMPASDSCADVKDADYAWGTGLTGGWQKSWQPWVSSKGGWACIRAFVNTGGRWAFAP